MTWKEFYAQLKSGALESVYLFSGPEEYLKREALGALRLWGDEESVRKELALVRSRLARSLEELEARRPEEEKRSAALCFSAAALLVIVLI